MQSAPQGDSRCCAVWRYISLVVHDFQSCLFVFASALPGISFTPLTDWLICLHPFYIPFMSAFPGRRNVGRRPFPVGFKNWSICADVSSWWQSLSFAICSTRSDTASRHGLVTMTASDALRTTEKDPGWKPVGDLRSRRRTNSLNRISALLQAES
jgi:hypothetical protein